ncbi:TerB family tellurite resistance protein [Granulosicoccaceae sp. 1_MG-2023]|nr:TerB family tellurite resistance protein [Granulosicoccaceae sp. 1_MG-2023]
MKALFQRLFAPQAGPSPDARPEEERLRLAAAALMMEVSRADYDMSGVELVRIRELLARALQLSEGQIDELVEAARRDSEHATSLHEFTRLINQHYSPAQKVDLFEWLWEVAYADGMLDKYEESLLRKIADLIYLSHQHFIQSKHRVLDRHGISHS